MTDMCYSGNSTITAIFYANNLSSPIYGVSAVVGTVSGTSIVFGSNTVQFNIRSSNQKLYYASSENKVFLGFIDVNFYLYGSVGTLSGASVSFNSYQTIRSIGDCYSLISLCYSSYEDRILFSYYDVNAHPYTILAAISGNSIVNIGTPCAITTLYSTYPMSMCYDATDDKIIGVYAYNSPVYYVAGSISGYSISYGTAAPLHNGTVAYVSSCYDSTDGKVIIAYSDAGNSNQGTCIVGTVSGTTVSFGSPVVFNTSTTNFTNTCYIANSTVVISYSNSNTSGQSIVGTVSGTSISFGTAVTFVSSDISSTSVASCYDSTDSKLVVAYGGGSTTGYAIVGTVSGTSISFGTAVQFSSVNTIWPSLCYITGTSTVVIAYSTFSSPYNGKAVVGTVSGTSISFGTAVTYNSYQSNYNSIVYTGNNIVIAYTNTNNNYGTSVVGTVSGTSITFGTPVVFNSASTTSTYGISISYDPYDSQVCIYYINVGNSNYGTAVIGSVSGTGSSATIIFTDSFLPASSLAATYPSVCYDSTDKQFVFSYNDTSNTRGAVVVAPNLGFIGLPSGFSGSTITYMHSSCCLGNGKFVIAYSDSNSPYYGYLVVGSVSGPSIVFGSPVTFSTSSTFYPSLYKINTNTVALLYTAGSYVYIVLGTVTGSTIALGPVTSVYTQYTSSTMLGSLIYSSTNNAVVISYTYNNGSYYYVDVVVGTISTNTVVLGTPVNISSSSNTFSSYTMDYLPNTNQFVVIYASGSSASLYAAVGTISGTSVSFGAAVTYSSVSNNYRNFVCAINSTTVVIGYDIQAPPYYYYAIVGTVSGTNITFGSPVAYDTIGVGTAYAAYSSVDQKLVIFSTDVSNPINHGAMTSMTISGSTITVGTILYIGITGALSVSYDASINQFIVTYKDYTTNLSMAKVLSYVGSNLSNLIGVSTQTVGNGASVAITTKGGVNSNQSGLTPGSRYYVNNAGTISTTVSNYQIGRAISATKLIVGP